jgi:4-diphosphocytidyl-2-C-methyl-D-erythritol kinase
MLSEDAPAKINLTLHVIGRRQDGYHLLDSLVLFAAACDRVSASVDDGLSLTVSGRFAAGLGSGPDNLVLRAARAFRDAAGVTAGASLHLHKMLPVASGIGGGSSDAAATLRLLGRLWSVRLPDTVLGEIALTLGADVPACLGRVPARMSGIGEILAPAPRLPPCGLALVNPGVAVSTPSVFKARQGPFSAPPVWPPGWSDARGLATALACGGNDLQDAAIALCPEIADVLNALGSSEGCLLARMSGSGATCFGLFETPAAAEAAAAALVTPGWWCWGGPPWRDAAGLYGTHAAT